jgi:hypothetical protein
MWWSHQKLPWTRGSGDASELVIAEGLGVRVKLSGENSTLEAWGPVPNKGLQAMANSVRSYLASALHRA